MEYSANHKLIDNQLFVEMIDQMTVAEGYTIVFKASKNRDKSRCDLYAPCKGGVVKRVGVGCCALDSLMVAFKKFCTNEQLVLAFGDKALPDVIARLNKTLGVKVDDM